MSLLSKEKLNHYKLKNNLTNLKISQLTNIPISNIDKIFSGANKNPTLDTLQKIAKILNCTIDDFIDYKIPPKSPVYIDRETEEISKNIVENHKLKQLFKNLNSLKDEDLDLILKLIEKFKS